MIGSRSVTGVKYHIIQLFTENAVYYNLWYIRANDNPCISGQMDRIFFVLQLF